MASFQEILDKQSTEREAPPVLPAGTYVCVIKGLPEYGKSSKKQTEYVKFTLQPTEALDDVDEEALTEMGGFASQTISAFFYDSDYFDLNINKFLDDCGIDEGQVRQRIEQTPGCSVLASIKHSARQDGQGIRAELGGTAKVGD